MFEFICKGCGEETSAEPKDFYFEEDGDTIDEIYFLTCPFCGRKHKCRQRFTWNGITYIE